MLLLLQLLVPLSRFTRRPEEGASGWKWEGATAGARYRGNRLWRSKYHWPNWLKQRSEDRELPAVAKLEENPKQGEIESDAEESQNFFSTCLLAMPEAVVRPCCWYGGRCYSCYVHDRLSCQAGKEHLCLKKSGEARNTRSFYG